VKPLTLVLLQWLANGDQGQNTPVLAPWIIRSENKGFCEDLTLSRR
jgi:hypothetical protein